GHRGGRRRVRPTASHRSGRARSAATETTSPPVARTSASVLASPASRRSAIATRAPARAKRNALARPMPVAAPVITAVLPRNAPPSARAMPVPSREDECGPPNLRAGPRVLTIIGPEVFHGDEMRRDRRGHLSSVHLPVCRRPARLHLQPVPRGRGGAPALPLRAARSLSRRLPGGDAGHGSAPATLDRLQSHRGGRVRLARRV